MDRARVKAVIINSWGYPGVEIPLYRPFSQMSSICPKCPTFAKQRLGKGHFCKAAFQTQFLHALKLPQRSTQAELVALSLVFNFHLFFSILVLTDSLNSLLVEVASTAKILPSVGAYGSATFSRPVEDTPRPPTLEKAHDQRKSGNLKALGIEQVSAADCADAVQVHDATGT